MRILSWNINGVRTLPQYHPWNTFKSFGDILEDLHADIICFQEMKTSRNALGRDVAVPPFFDSFFSFPANKGGYSGVAIYTDSRTVIPLRAEEGLSGKLQPKPPLSPDERISKIYPREHEMDLISDEQTNSSSDLLVLDAEGRGLVLDLGLFVLINVYCPNETSDARLPFKMNYHYMLQERVEKLIKEGREVIVVGDINICSSPLDHCDGHLPSNASSFYDHPARAWFHQWLEPVGNMTDIVRQFWPDRKGLFTCWNTKISARETNYGTRVDYILVTRGLLPWIKHGDIQPHLKGSDHCPIYIDFHDEIVLDSGAVLTLREAMQLAKQRPLPRLAAKNWDAFSGKQKKLLTFFGKKGDDDVVLVPPSKLVAPGLGSSAVTPVLASSGEADSSNLTTTPTVTPSLLQSDDPPSAAIASSSKSPSVPTTTSLQKRKSFTEQQSSDKANKKIKNGQTQLSNFFVKPSPARTPSSSPTENNVAFLDHLCVSLDDQLESDHQLALRLSSLQEESPQSSSSQSKTAWSQLLAPVQPPNCAVHNEPAKQYTVNKNGPNKGKTFFLCSRPVGPGYDKGRSERPREEVNNEYRCNYFKWTSDVRRENQKLKATPSKP